mmetsp:Transcript_43769/g.121626  ORF Transcript_43769/g.121626 Transcript_43769/m.121626 type:complete len:305 (-) Transcript_43769:704-1618(-)
MMQLLLLQAAGHAQGPRGPRRHKAAAQGRCGVGPEHPHGRRPHRHLPQRWHLPQRRHTAHRRHHAHLAHLLAHVRHASPHHVPQARLPHLWRHPHGRLHAGLGHAGAHHRLLLRGQRRDGRPLRRQARGHLHGGRRAVIPHGGLHHVRRHRRNIRGAVLQHRHRRRHVRGRLPEDERLDLGRRRHKGSRLNDSRHGLPRRQDRRRLVGRSLLHQHRRWRVRRPLVHVELLTAGVLGHLPGRVEARGVHCKRCRSGRCGGHGDLRHRGLLRHCGRRRHVREVHRHGLRHQRPRHHRRCLVRGDHR